jgi:hypothetical protein
MTGCLYLASNQLRAGHYKIGRSRDLSAFADDSDWRIAAEVAVDSTERATRMLQELLRQNGYAVADITVGDGPTETEIFGASFSYLQSLLRHVAHTALAY